GRGGGGSESVWGITKPWRGGWAGALGLVRAGTMFTGCMPPDGRATTTTPPRIPRVNSASSQTPAGTTGATGTNTTNAAGQNANSMYQNTNWTGQNSNGNATNLLPTNSPAVKPAGSNSPSPYGSIQSNNM